MSRATLVIGERAGRDVERNHARRRPRARVRRRRWLLAGAALLLAASLAAGVGWLMRSDVLAVTRVETGPYRFTSERDLQQALRGFLGRNLLTLGEADVAAAVTALPWIRDVRLTRRWPTTLAVDVREWRPVAAIALENADDGPDLVLREDGRVVPLPDLPVPPALPVLVGFSVARGDDGTWSLEASRKDAILALLAAVEATGLESAAAVDFLLAGERGYDILLQEGRGRLLVGKEDFHRRLQKYLAARDRIPPGGLVDLRYRDRVSVRPSAS